MSCIPDIRVVSYEKYVKAVNGLSFITKVLTEKAGWWDPLTLDKRPSPWSYPLEFAVEWVG